MPYAECYYSDKLLTEMERSIRMGCYILGNGYINVLLMLFPMTRT